MMRILLFVTAIFASVQIFASTQVLQTLSTLPTVAGTQLKLDPQAKGYVVVFVSAKCPCSDSHVPELKELSQKYKEFQFIGVHSNMDETKEMTETYFKKAGLPFALLHDNNAQVADELKAYKTPHVFVLSKEGEILYQGGVTNSATASKATEHFLRSALDDLQASRPVKITNGRTLGCVIAREKNQNVW